MSTSNASTRGIAEVAPPDLSVLLGINHDSRAGSSLHPLEGHSRSDLKRVGRARRERASRKSQAVWRAPDDRPDPVTILKRTNRGRVAELLPIRAGRMAASPFAYLRGSPAMMACDFASLPSPGIRVQACGDAHISNFGGFASPERRLVFDLNDFDETLPAPWEWDVKRLATSTVVAARENGVSEDDALMLATRAARAYRRVTRELSNLTMLEIWYANIEIDRVAKLLDAPRKKRLRKAVAKARRRDSMQALKKLTEIVDGTPRIRPDPPLIEHLPQTDDHEQVERVLRRYAQTLRGEERHLLSGFQLVDVARKVVGVGSVGTRCFAVLLAGKADGSPLFLQVKEAIDSVLEPYAGPSKHKNHAARVVEGQLLMQAVSDPFLGFVSVNRRDFYVRQLRDMKASVDLAGLDLGGLEIHSRLCGAALARSHARSCHPALIAGYLGSGEGFDNAIGRFAVAYADQNERDFERFLAAIDSGRVECERGL